MSGPDAKTVVADTRLWIKDFVIALNLCPFAAKPFQAELIRYQVCAATGIDEIYRALLTELDQFNQLSAEVAETGLLILSRGLKDFEQYLDLLEQAEQALVDAGLQGSIQLASFHPDYCFAGEAPDDPANATNRSPYPMFHLIREDIMEAALASYPEPEKIPERNMRLLREMARKE